jgi:hypothetical protein
MVFNMNIKDKNGNADLNGFQMVFLGFLVFLLYWALWSHGVQYDADRGEPVSQWNGFQSCFVFTAIVYIFVKICRKIGGW